MHEQLGGENFVLTQAVLKNFIRFTIDPGHLDITKMHVFFSLNNLII